MPKLPSAENLGPVRSAESGRPIASVDTTGVGAGMASFGGSLNRVGDDLRRTADHIERQDDQLDLARANAHALTGDVQLRAGFKEDDQNYSQWGEKYKEGASKLNNEGAALIRNPRLRERWLLNRQDDIARGEATVQQQVQKRTNDKIFGDSNTQLENVRRAALEAPDEETRQKLITSGQAIIDGLEAKGILGSDTAQKYKRQWVEKYAEEKIQMLPADVRVDSLRGKVTNIDGVVNRIVGAESGGNPNAKNPNSSASGVGQFIDSTWLSFMKDRHPDIYDAKSMSDVLKLKSDPQLGRDAVKWYAEQNAEALSRSGLQATPGNVYLAHFLGPAGAIRVLKSDPNASSSDVIDPGAIKANGFLRGKSSGEVIAWAERKMGGKGTAADIAGLISPERRVALLRGAETEVSRDAIEVAKSRSESWERSIIDAGANIAPLPPRANLENDPVLDEGRRNTLLRQYDAASREAEIIRSGMAKFSDPNALFNAYDPNDKKAVDGVFKSLGGDMKALQTVVDRTKILPESAGTALRGGLISTDPERVGTTLQVASNLLGTNANIFSGMTGGDDIEKAALAFSHYTEHLGFTQAEAAARFIKTQTPEYKAELQTRMKTEDIDEMLRTQAKKGALTADLTKTFDESWFSDPKVEFSPQARQAAMNAYADLIKEFYLETGNMALAKSQAQAQMKKIWGVTRVNGSSGGVVMRFPPEKAPAYAGIENVGEAFAADAISEIKAQYGADVERGALIVMPLPKGQTSRAFHAGQAVPYNVGWKDQNEIVHFLNPGKGFVLYPEAARASQSEARRKALEDAQSGGRSELPPIIQPGGLASQILGLEPGREQTPSEKSRPQLMETDVLRPGDNTLPGRPVTGGGF